MVNYIIGTGWWCDGTFDGGWVGSWNFQRSQEFSALWYHFINKYTNPKKIVMVDNASPLKPLFLNDGKVEIISMDRNFKHVRTGHPGLWCGQMRGIMLCAFYALMNDADYFVFIEQDCLVRGIDWIENTIAKMEKAGAEISYGWKDHEYRADHTVIIVKNSAILDFIRNYTAIQQKDYDVRPELKYLFVHGDKREVSHYQWVKERRKLEQAKLAFPIKRLKFMELPFPYGAIHDRKIDFNKPIVSAQQWSKPELLELLRIEELKLETFTKGKEFSVKTTR